MHWKKQLADHWSLLEHLARRRFRDANLADEALDYVLEALAEDDGQRIRAYRGEAQFSTYLTHLAVRLMEDWARKKFGRRTAPPWVQAAGTLWRTAYQRLCVEGWTPREVVEALVDTVPGGYTREQVAEVVAELRRRIAHCRDPVGEHREQMIDEEELARIPADDDPPDALVEAEERICVLDILRAVVWEEAVSTPHHEKWASFAQRLKASIELDSEERLLLRMIYQDGMNATEAGKMLGLGQHQTHGRLRRLLRRFRESWDQAGLSETLADLLSAP